MNEEVRDSSRSKLDSAASHRLPLRASNVLYKPPGQPRQSVNKYYNYDTLKIQSLLWIPTNPSRRSSMPHNTTFPSNPAKLERLESNEDSKIRKSRKL
jgi:hypothetical protein